MKNKTERLITIRNLILAHSVKSQDELLSLLLNKGFDLTQATLSRDFKQLKVAKIADSSGEYVYTIPGMIIERSKLEDQFVRQGFVSIEFSGQMAVIKTKPGFANGIASVIDLHKPFEVLGTIAGDDTILVILREGVSKSGVISALALIFPEVSEKS